MAAAAAAGLYPNLREAVQNMTSPGDEYQPNPRLAGCYDALYDVYLGLYPALRQSFVHLSQAPCDAVSDEYTP